MRYAIEEGDEAAGNAGDWTTETVVDPHLQSTDVKVVKVGIERRVALEIQVSLAVSQRECEEQGGFNRNRDREGLYILLTKMGVFVLLESFPEKVSNVTKDDENEVGDVSSNQIKVRRLVHDRLGHSGPARMATDMTMGEISNASELSIAPGLLLPVARIVGGSGGSLMLLVLCPGRRDPDAGHRQRRQGGSSKRR
jgi:hypothetical protein